MIDVEKLDTHGFNKKSKKYADLSLALKARDLKLAIKEASKILEKNPEDAVVYNALSVLAINKGYYYLAELYMGKIKNSKKIPNTTLENNLAMILVKKGYPEQAFNKYYKSAIKDKNAVSSANAGTVLLKYHNFEIAEEYLKKAAKAYPNDSAILNNYAVSLKNLGRVREAEKFFKKSIKFASSGNEGWVKLNYARLIGQPDLNPKEAKKTLNEITFSSQDKNLISQAKTLLREIK